MRYSTQTQHILLSAAQIAKEFGHGYVGSAHLLLALLQEKSTAGQILRSFGLSSRTMENMVAVLSYWYIFALCFLLV